MAVSPAISVEQESLILYLCYCPRKLRKFKAFCASFSTESLNRLFQIAWTMCVIFCFNLQGSLVHCGLYNMGHFHSIYSE